MLGLGTNTGDMPIDFRDRPVDGLDYNLMRFYSPNNYSMRCLQNIEFLRGARQREFKLYVLPDTQFTGAQSANTSYSDTMYSQQLRVTPGSFIYGLALFDPTNGTAQIIGGLQITNAVTNEEYFRTFTQLNGKNLQTNQGRGSAHYPLLLPEPICVPPPGLLNVQVTAGEGQNWTLLLWSNEPMTMPTTVRE